MRRKLPDYFGVSMRTRFKRVPRHALLWDAGWDQECVLNCLTKFKSILFAQFFWIIVILQTDSILTSRLVSPLTSIYYVTITALFSFVCRPPAVAASVRTARTCHRRRCTRRLPPTVVRWWRWKRSTPEVTSRAPWRSRWERWGITQTITGLLLCANKTVC